MAVVLGLGLLICDCRRAQELEPLGDAEPRTAASFLYSSLLGVWQVERVFAEVVGICSQLDQEVSVEPGPVGKSGGEEAEKQRQEEEAERQEEIVRQ